MEADGDMPAGPPGDGAHSNLMTPCSHAVPLPPLERNTPKYTTTTLAQPRTGNVTSIWTHQQLWFWARAPRQRPALYSVHWSVAAGVCPLRALAVHWGRRLCRAQVPFPSAHSPHAPERAIHQKPLAQNQDSPRTLSPAPKALHRPTCHVSLVTTKVPKSKTYPSSSTWTLQRREHSQSV